MLVLRKARIGGWKERIHVQGQVRLIWMEWSSKGIEAEIAIEIGCLHCVVGGICSMLG